MKPENCYLVLYNDEQILFSRQFESFKSKYKENSTFYGIRGSKAGINIPKDVKYFSIVYLPPGTNSLNLMSKGHILLAEDFPELNTFKKFFSKNLNKQFNVNVKNLFFTVTISNSKKAINS
jgi:hypothetical protein